MDDLLKLEINYNVANDKFDYVSNIRPELVKDIVAEFLRMQIGKGADLSESDERDSYSVSISLDLSHDHFSVSDNCGNKGLRDGILMCFIKSAIIKEVKE